MQHTFDFTGDKTDVINALRQDFDNQALPFFEKIEKERVGSSKDGSYTHQFSSSEYRSSGSCNVNVNCSEGDDFRKQQRAVARILVKMDAYTMGWCTGTLINNTNYDRTPYLLTAAHCIESVSSSSYYSQFVFYFNYETSGCSTPSQ